MKKLLQFLFGYFERNRFYLFLFVFLLVLHVFLRFFELEARMQFTWDQVRDAWVMKDMIVDGKFPLLGTVAKGNSGFFTGPAYYYLLAPFYLMTNLDPIAAGIFSGVVSTVTFLALYIITKKIFSHGVALCATFLYTVSSSANTFDRVPWNVIFIPFVSLLMLYFLYELLKGNIRSLIPLSIVLGFSFHIHFTSIYYLPIILLSLPLWPRKKETVIYGIIGLGLFALWFIPNVIAEFGNKSGSTDKLAVYLQTYYHGFHLRRVAQLFHDAFIQFEGIVSVKPISRFAYLAVPIFAFVLTRTKPNKSSLALIYLLCLWIGVPWIIMSLYSGEISNYYFAISRPLVFMTIGYIIWSVVSVKNIFSGLTIVLLGLYTLINLQNFWLTKYVTLPKYKAEVRQEIKEGRTIKFSEGDPKSYLYYIYAERESGK